jgi:uncharacterized protein DUF1559
MRRRALTLLELLAILAIIGILVALLLPAVQGAREASRRTQCSSNMRQLAMALHAYESVNRVLPNTAPNNYSFHVFLLPYLEQKALFDEFDFSLNALQYLGPLSYRRVQVFECPSDGSCARAGQLMAVTNYHGNWGSGAQRYGNNGIFSYSNDHAGFVLFLPLAAITDGLSQTAMLAEVTASDNSRHPLRILWNIETPMRRPEQFEQFATACRDAPRLSSAAEQLLQSPRGRPWLQLGTNWTIYNHVLTPNQASYTNGGSFLSGVYTSRSCHPGIVNVSLADGSVQSVSDSIDITAWRALGSSAGDP